MIALEAMILWTPNREPFLNSSLAGTVVVTEIPEDPLMRMHPMSVGACDHNWVATDEAGRAQLMQRYFSQMLHRDNIPEDTIIDALSNIIEFEDVRFSTARPDGDDWL